MQDDDIPGIVRFRTYEVLKEEVANPRLRWAYLPYSMHMAGPREAIQHMIIRRNYGDDSAVMLQWCCSASACCFCCPRNTRHGVYVISCPLVIGQKLV